MNTTTSPKTLILSTLLHSTWSSGQALAAAAGISRTAIWKHIHALREEGYPIQASSGLGYRLDHLPDLLTAEAVQAGLQTRIVGRTILARPEVDSTQTVAKELLAQGATDGTVVLAASQSQGRGRRGRTWASIPHGVAMSILLKPDILPDKAPRFPILAGVAMARAISRISELEVGLKWPNDILVEEKKVVGILAELAAEMDGVNGIFLGIGININAGPEDIPAELQSIATSLRIQAGHTINRVHLIQAALEELEKVYLTYQTQGFAPIRQAWKEQNITLGRQVQVIFPNQTLTGTAEDMDTTGALILRTEDHTQLTVTAGEVQLRPRSQQTG